MRNFNALLLSLLLLVLFASAQDEHSHRAPEQLGKVSFPTSCAPAAQEQFNRGMALVHSFAYSTARDAFQAVARQDPKCAMARWGIAFSYFRQLWDPPLLPDTISAAQEEINRAQKIGAPTERETAFLRALALIYADAPSTPYSARISNYEHAMGEIASKNPNDAEAQVLYALALLANASPSDKTHSRQKQAADILEPLWRSFPEHPGIPHYLIHAYDNAELAKQGLVAARAYSKIAPSAPHALHMPSHIFTRLGLWDDSVSANLAARESARQQGDIGEQLHAMEYLVYAYLQAGRDNDAAKIIQQLTSMSNVKPTDFKVAYASTVMPIRYAVERRQWKEAASIVPPAGAPPQVAAVAAWARGLGLIRSGRAADAADSIPQLKKLEEQLRSTGKDYWATQTNILLRELMAWQAQAQNRPEEALKTLRSAADDEDAIEKLPVTPGPIIPAREQLGDLLLEQNQPDLARKEFETALQNAPGRRGSIQGAARAAELASKQ